MSQTTKLLALLSDGQPHSTLDIMEKVYGNSHLGLARVGARVYDLRQKGHEIEGKKDKENPAIYWYKLVLKLEDEKSSEVEKETRPSLQPVHSSKVCEERPSEMLHLFSSEASQGNAKRPLDSEKQFSNTLF